MSITEVENAFVNPGAVTIGLSQMFAVTPGGSNPAYLVVSALDRNEYTVGVTGATGQFNGNGRALSLAGVGGDGRGAGIVFTYQSVSGRYYSAQYGYFDQLSFTSSASVGDVTNLSLFGFSSLSYATAYAGDPVSLMQVDAGGYLGSATVATQPGFGGPVPTQATPQSVARIAQSFVGQAWNNEGCWVLASTIAAEAGASLPMQSTLIGLSGQANGEWMVAFDGPAGQTGNWQSLVHAGEMVVIGTPDGGGHITTCVSGSGESAMLVDNIMYVDGSNHVQNSANDGSSADIIIAAPHAASQEWSGVLASSVVIYELDVPVVTATTTRQTLACLASRSLGSLFTAADPAGKAVTLWQVYDTALSDSLVLNGSASASHAQASALTVASLGNVALLAGSVATTDTLQVRAFNGSYWGDWAALAVTIVAATPTIIAPLLAVQTASQTWLSGRGFSLTLPASTFQDPQGQALTYTARLASGQALPSWLTYNAATDTFSGVAPDAAQSLSITVTAINSSGLSATDTFAAKVFGAPTVSNPTASQTWLGGKAVAFALPANTFTDPQGQALTIAATLANGKPLPSWLSFNAAIRSFAGTTPTTPQSLQIRVTATDTSGLSSSESFGVAIQVPTPTPAPTRAPLPTPAPGITLTAPTPDQVWTAGQTSDLVLPSSIFTDALGLRMSFAAYQVSGPNATGWLRFDPATLDFRGSVPAGASGTIGIALIATDALQRIAVDMFNITVAQNGTQATVHAIAAQAVQGTQNYVMGLYGLHA